MLERHIEVRRTARYYVLGAVSPDVLDVWIVLHGFAQLASRFLRRFEPLAGEGRIVVAPEALNRFYLDTSPRPHGPDAVVGATWMTREDRENEIRDYVNLLDAVHDDIMLRMGVASARVHLLGFSQGAATLARWVSTGRVEPRQVVIWSGFVPLDVDLAAVAQRWKKARVCFVWGSEDASLTGELVANEQDRFAAAHIPCEWIPFHGGHEIRPEVLRLLARPG
jgi:predicted esterase